LKGKTPGGRNDVGVTEPCVLAARDLLETEGYEVLVFSGGGKGPASMEELALDGAIDLVMDITTTSLVDEVAGGPDLGTGRLSVPGTRDSPGGRPERWI
jgi:uncharacterized protein (UPF0261 family)